MPKAKLNSELTDEGFRIRTLAVQMLLGFLIGVTLALALVISYTASLKQLLSSGHTFVACLLFASGTGILFAVGASATFLLSSKR